MYTEALAYVCGPFTGCFVPQHPVQAGLSTPSPATHEPTRFGLSVPIPGRMLTIISNFTEVRNGAQVFDMMKSERIYTENPKQSVWDRIEVLTTYNGAKAELSRTNSGLINPMDLSVLDEKSKGIAFCARSAKDMFLPSSSNNPTARLTSLYYGTYNLLCALLIGEVNHNLTLSDIEKFSQNGGHGLKTIYEESKPELIDSEFIYICTNGFFPNLLQKWGYDVAAMAMTRNFKKLEDIPASEKHKLISLRDLLSRIPELRNIYIEIFKAQPNYIHYHANWYPGKDIYEKIEVSMFHNSEFLLSEQINEILRVDPKYKFGKSNDRFLCQNEIPVKELSRNPEYQSPLSSSVNINPVNGINNPLLINLQTLYMLSIWTRYRPNLWRKVCEGEHDQLRSLFNIYIDVVERIVPNLFLNKFYGREFTFASHSYYS